MRFVLAGLFVCALFLPASAQAGICWEKTGTRKVESCDVLSQESPLYVGCISQCDAVKALVDDPDSLVNADYVSPFCETYCADSSDPNCVDTCNIPSTDMFAGECENLCLADLEDGFTSPPPQGILIRYEMPKPDQTASSSGTVYNWDEETLEDFALAIDVIYRLFVLDPDQDPADQPYLQSLDSYFSALGGPVRSSYGDTESDGQQYINALVSFISTQETSSTSTQWLSAQGYATAQDYADARNSCKYTQCEIPSGCDIYCDGDNQCQEMCDAFAQGSGATDCGRYCDDYVLSNCSSYWEPKIDHEVYTSCDSDAEPKEAEDEDGNDHSTRLIVDWQEGEDHDTAKYPNIAVDADAMFYAGLFNEGTYDAGICVWSGGQGWRAASDDDSLDEVDDASLSAGALAGYGAVGGPIGLAVGLGVGSLGEDSLSGIQDGLYGVWTPWSLISNILPLDTREQDEDWEDEGSFSSDLTSHYSTLKSLESLEAYVLGTDDPALYDNQAPVPSSSDDNYEDDLKRYSPKLCYRVPLVSGPPPCCKVLTAPAATPETRDIAASALPDPIPDEYSTFYDPAVRVLFPSAPTAFVDLKWSYPANAQGAPLTRFGVPHSAEGQGVLTDPGQSANNRIFEVSMRPELPQRDICAVEIDADGTFVRSVGCEDRPMDMSLNWSMLPVVSGEGIGSRYDDPKIQFSLNGQSVVLRVNHPDESCAALFGSEFCAYKTVNAVNDFDNTNQYICVSGFQAMDDATGRVRPVTPNQPLPPGDTPSMPEGICVLSPAPPCLGVASPASYNPDHGFAAWAETELGSTTTIGVDGVCANGYETMNGEPVTRECVRESGEYSRWDVVSNACERRTCPEENLSNLVGTAEANFATYWPESLAGTDPEASVDNPAGVHEAGQVGGLTCLDSDFTLRRDASNNPVIPTRSCTSEGLWTPYNTMTSPCVPRTCMAYTDTQQHIVVGADASVSEVVQGQCMPGFGTRSGNAPQVSCVSDLTAGGQGVWNFDTTEACLPQCNAYTDESITIAQTGWEGDEVTAQCADGYIPADYYAELQENGYNKAEPIATGGETTATCGTYVHLGDTEEEIAENQAVLDSLTGAPRDEFIAARTRGQWEKVEDICVPAPVCEASDYKAARRSGTNNNYIPREWFSDLTEPVEEAVLGTVTNDICRGDVRAECYWNVEDKSPEWQYRGACSTCSVLSRDYSTSQLNSRKDEVSPSESWPGPNCSARIVLPQAYEGTVITQMRDMCVTNNNERFTYECQYFEERTIGETTIPAGLYWQYTNMCFEQ